MTKAPKKAEKKVETTGHEWDGIQELNNPLPRWWLWTFYGCIVFALGYMVLYPAWPISKEGATPGLLHWSTRADVAKDIKKFDAANGPLEAKLVATDLTKVKDDAELYHFATRDGAAVFRTWCAQCHGAGAAGNKGFPNLLDDDWLWGGDIETIYTTVKDGIRSASDDDTRSGEMPAWGDVLEPEELTQVVNYVMSLSGEEADATLAQAGATVFADNCAACHGDDAKGDRDQGAPNLTDAIWLYGGDKDTITQTVTNGRHGVMPNWNTRLSDTDIRAAALYVHQLGGGE